MHRDRRDLQRLPDAKYVDCLRSQLIAVLIVTPRRGSDDRPYRMLFVAGDTRKRAAARAGAIEVIVSALKSKDCQARSQW